MKNVNIEDVNKNETTNNNQTFMKKSLNLGFTE